MKRGFTIIEIIITLSIISVILAISTPSFSGIGKLRNSDEGKYGANLILDFINNSRQYCRENEVEGYIVFDIANSSLYFKENIDIIYKLNLAKYIKLDGKNFNSKSGYLYINKRGQPLNAGTIAFSNKNGEDKSITVTVGSGYISVKN